MVAKSTEKLIAGVSTLNFNPTEVYRMFLKATQELSNGEQTYYDVSTPTMQAIEAGVFTSTAVLREIQTITRQMFSSAIDDWDSLYLHMQDIDNKNISAQAGTVKAEIILSLEELKQKAVPIDNVSGVRMIVFPAHTQIVVNEISMMLKRPVVIRINRHDNISIKYDLSTDSVFTDINAAVIDFSLKQIGDMIVISIPVECVQARMVSQVIDVTPSTGFKNRLSLTDKFYRLKAYTRFTKEGPWIEIDVTHRLKVLNKNKATLQVQVADSTMVVQVPHFYFNNNMIGTSIRLDIYTTKGKFEHNLASYADSSYAMRYFDYNNKNNEYAGVLGSFKVLRCFSTGTISGGADALSFDEAKNIVVNRSTISEGLPITEKELKNFLARYDFTTVKIKDNVTERLYAASRLLPAPENLTVTGVGCNVHMLQTTIDQLATHETVRNNGNRLTVLPTTLYNIVNGVMEIIPASTVNTMTDPNQTAPENLAAWANASSLVFSPYYYVHDVSNNEYTVRTYRLDKPVVSNKITVNENPTLQLDAGVYNYEFISSPNGDGYILLLGLNVSKSFLEIDPANISLQISYSDDGGANRYFLNGTLQTRIDPSTGLPLDNNYVYRFDFLTNWDVDPNHRLMLAGGQLPMPLDVDLDVFIIIKDFEPQGFSKTAMDNVISISTLDNFDGRGSQYALIQERLSVSFGKYMKNLWQRFRTSIDASDYKRYTENVPATHETTTYKIDPETKVVEMTYDADLKRMVPVVLHKRGDLVYDTDTGLQIFKHHINDIVKEFGLPVYKEGLRGLKRQYDIVVMDGLYYLSTHTDTISYVRSMLDLIDTWTLDILKDIVTPELIQRTTVMFYPKSTVGLIPVYVENGVKTNVLADQSIFVRFFVTEGVFNNIDLRNSLEKTAKIVIQEVLSGSETIDKSDIIRAIRDALGTNILGVELKGFMNDENNTITVADGLTTPSIGKRLVVNSKLELVVEDDVEFDFVNHTYRQSN